MKLLLWGVEAGVRSADIAGRCLAYWATHQTSARYLCALCYEMEALGYPQWAALRMCLDAARGAGHCREMWLEEMGYAEKHTHPGSH